MANYGTTAVFGDPRSPGWEDANLVSLSIPGGQRWRVHRAAAPAFRGLLDDLLAAGYAPTSSGGYNYRTIRGSDRLSQHAYGNAIDINAATNPMLQGQLQTDMPAGIGEIAARHGLEWGGNWKNRPDPMHFEWTGGGNPAMPGSSQPFSVPLGAPLTAADLAPLSPLTEMFTAPQEAYKERIDKREEEEQRRKAALFGGGLAGLYG